MLFGAAAAHAAEDKTQSIIAGAMRTTMSGKATIDDETIRDVELRAPCLMAFTTNQHSILIDWTTVGNLAPRVEGAFEVTELNSPSGSHRIAVPSGAQANRIGSSLTMLDLTCHNRR